MTVGFPHPMHEKLLDAASDSGVTRNEIVRKAVAQYLTRGSPDDYRHRELVLSGTRGAYTVDKVLEWLLAKRPAVADLTMSGGELDARMKRVIRKSLPKKQAERVVLRFEGRNLDEPEEDDLRKYRLTIAHYPLDRFE